MKGSITIFVFMLAAMAARAQSEQVTLLVQSPDGKTVKLLWLPKGRIDAAAFDIKRKEGLQDWEKLNKAPIEAGISVKKSLYIVESNKSEVIRLVNKANELLRAGKLHLTDNTFPQKLATDDNTVQDLSKTIGQDYDLALINGFAYVDHSAINHSSYQYGIFAAGTNKLLATATWNYGAIPDLNIVKDITSRSEYSKKGVTLTWNADVNKMRAGYVAGFNVYRTGIRLNETPIVATNSKDLSEFSWVDKGAPAGEMQQYSISAETIIGLEGIITPYTYNPAEHVREYKRGEVLQVKSLGYYFKDGISIHWNFPKEYEHYVKYVYLEKDNIPDGYKRISPMMPPSARSFVDTTGSPVNDYVRFRVVTVYNDRTSVAGTDRLYNYFPIPQPPIPMNVKAKAIQEDRKYTVNLGWDQPMQGDTGTSYYKVYIGAPGSRNMSLIADKVPVKPGGCKYVIQHGTTALYRFAVSAVNKQGAESSMSDTVSIQVPSLEIPAPAINKVIVASQNIQIKWDYPEIPDVKGFRLFQNEEVIATENELKKGIRDFVTSKLDQGMAYDFTLRAVTENGVVSDLSAPATINIPDAKK